MFVYSFSTEQSVLHRNMNVKCAVLFVFIGGFMLTVGIALHSLFNVVLKYEMEKMLPLFNGSFAYKMWRDLPVPMYLQVYVFDVINADDVMESGAKPYVVEKGPYTYRLRKEKINITTNPNKTVTFRQLCWYYFDRDRSVGDETDNFTTINNILLGSAYMTRFEYPFIKEMVKLLLDTLGGELYQTYTVRDMLWGYEDPLLKIIKNDVLGYFNLSSLFDDHFGFFYKWNGSDTGLFTVFDGEEQLSSLNVVDKYNGLGYAPYWSTPYARMINGTDGTFFPPFLDKKKPLYFYSADACRSLNMEYRDDTTVMSISGHRYVLPNSLFESGTVNPDNVGFCTPDITHCMPTGVLNVSGCRDASSAVMSNPHFLGGTPELIHGVGGLHPDPSQHASYMDLEPISSVPLDVAMRLQIAVYVSKFAEIRQLRNARTYFHPILWFNETATITTDLAKELRSELLLAVHIVAVLKYLLPCLGALMIVITAAYIIRKRYKNKKTKTDSADCATSPIISEDT